MVRFTELLATTIVSLYSFYLYTYINNTFLLTFKWPIVNILLNSCMRTSGWDATGLEYTRGAAFMLVYPLSKSQKKCWIKMRYRMRVERTNRRAGRTDTQITPTSIDNGRLYTFNGLFMLSFSIHILTCSHHKRNNNNNNNNMFNCTIKRRIVWLGKNEVHVERAYTLSSCK